MTPVRVFDIWRGWLESENIAVLKIKMPVEDARGFSLTDGEPYVIVVNSADADRARLFTLFHEYAHILLNMPVVCNQGDGDLDEYAEIEHWCNHFAGAFLAPSVEIEKNPDIQQALKSGNYIRAAGSIRQRFLISKEAGLMRLLTLKKISSSQFIQGRDQLRKTTHCGKREGKRKSNPVKRKRAALRESRWIGNAWRRKEPDTFLLSWKISGKGISATATPLIISMSNSAIWKSSRNR